MVKGVDFFNTVELLEPRCKGCKTKIDYGVSTEYSDEKEAHVCKTCGTIID